MNVGIYKPGQGYWVRVLTATLIGVLTLAAAGWVFSQMGLVAEKLPRTVWVLKLNAGLPTPPAEGESVTLMSKATTDSPSKDVGTASVRAYSEGGRELRVNNVVMNAGYTDAGVAGAVKVGSVNS